MNSSSPAPPGHVYDRCAILIYRSLPGFCVVLGWAYMKKHLVIGFVIFFFVVALSLASNFIPWDETPLEQTALALPLGAGLLLQLPFFTLLGALNPNFHLAGYNTSWIVIPFIAGMLYAALYYYAVTVITRPARA